MLCTHLFIWVVCLLANHLVYHKHLGIHVPMDFFFWVSWGRVAPKIIRWLSPFRTRTFYKKKSCPKSQWNNAVWWVNVNCTSNVMYTTYIVANTKAMIAPPLWHPPILRKHCMHPITNFNFRLKKQKPNDTNMHILIDSPLPKKTRKKRKGKKKKSVMYQILVFMPTMPLTKGF